jgi:phage/plasmid-like protein (TIGR03299 family)
MENQVQDLLNQTNLNWSVRTENLQTSSGIIIPDKIGIIREDDNTVLGIHSNGYVPYQNEQMMELLYKVSNKTGLEIHSGGLFNGGGKVYVQLKSDDLRLGTDRIEGYITGINSFDGSTSLSFGPSSKTISCQNTFWGAYRDMKNKVRHTKSLEIRVEEIVQEINKVEQVERQMFDNIVRLSETRIGQGNVDDVIRKLFNIERNVDFRNEDSISTVTRNKLSTFYVDLNGEIQEKGDTLWGLFSGVTKFTTHSMGKSGNTENKIFGTYGNREREIYQDLVSLV